jgi:hypothetical protein
MNEQPCTRGDLRVEVIASSYVEDNGQPTFEEVLDTAGINEVEKPYFCVGPHAEGSVEDFVTWEEALAHLEKVI